MHHRHSGPHNNARSGVSPLLIALFLPLYAASRSWGGGLVAFCAVYAAVLLAVFVQHGRDMIAFRQQETALRNPCPRWSLEEDEDA